MSEVCLTSAEDTAELVIEKPESFWASGQAIVLLIAASKFITQMLFSGRYGLHGDELYFLACSEHLAWGYIDCPPLIAGIAFVARHLLGDSLPGLRLFSALSGALLVWIAASITREMGGKRFALAITAIAVLVTPAYLLVHHLLHIVAFDPLVWAACAYFAVRAVNREAPHNWLWLGIVAGLGMELKYTISVFLIGLLLGVLCTSARKQMATWQLWAGAGLAVLLFAPNLNWEIVHHFPFLEWQRFIRTHTGVQTFNFSLIDFGRAQAMYTLPALAVWVAGLCYFLFSPRGQRFRFLAISIIVVLVVASRSGKPHYAIPVYAIAFACGGVALEHLTELADRQRLRSVLVVIMLTVGIIMAPCFLPILPPERFAAYQRSLHLPLPVRAEYYEYRSEMPGHLASEFGKDEILSAVAQLYNALPEDQKAKTGILTSEYGAAGAIDLWGKNYGLPKAICGQLSYHDFGPRSYTGESLIIVGYSFEEDRKVCDSVKSGAYIRNPYGYMKGPIVNLCLGLHANPQREWPLFKHY